MDFFSWVIFGAIAGWIASIILGVDEKQGCATNVIVGVIGAAVGGFLFEVVVGEGIDFAFDIRSFIVAVIGAVILLGITGATREK